jgi:hypothetical protein
MPDTPLKFCKFQRGYDLRSQRYHCAITDWQCDNPLCSYKTKRDLPKKGCGIANLEGKAIEVVLGGELPEDAVFGGMTPITAHKLLIPSSR